MGKRSLRRREIEIIHPEMFKKYYKNSRRLMRYAYMFMFLHKYWVLTGNDR
jgi:hypothetical protein